jgi:hypothetical protein
VAVVAVEADVVVVACAQNTCKHSGVFGWLRTSVGAPSSHQSLLRSRTQAFASQLHEGRHRE